MGMFHSVISIPGMDRIPVAGSTRCLLSFFFIGIWIKNRDENSKWVRIIVLPSVLFTFFYSPDVGFYLAPAALILMILDLTNPAKHDSKKNIYLYLSGLALSL